MLVRTPLAMSILAVAVFVAQGSGQDAKPKIAKKFSPDELGKLVGVTDPQISPDGKSVVVRVSRPDYDKNVFDAELVLVDVATGKQRILTYDRQGVGRARWSPRGDRLAFLANSNGKPQIYVMPMNGGDAKKITDAPEGIRDYAWKPDGSEFAFASPEGRDPSRKKNDDAFEVGNNDFLAMEAPRPIHVWLISSDGGKARRLTSGSWTLTSVPPPGPPSSPLQWSPDGTSLAIVRQEKLHSGERDQVTIQVIDIGTGMARSLTGRKTLEQSPSFSPDGSRIAYWYPRDGERMSVNEIYVVPAAGGESRSVTRDLDRCVYHSQWLSSDSLLIGGNDGTSVSLWVQPLNGMAKKLDLGNVSPSWSFGHDATVSNSGAIAFTGTESDHPTELYFLSSPDAQPKRLTELNAEVAGFDLGRTDTIQWKSGKYPADGILAYPPGFDKSKKYPLVLLIHGGPRAASTIAFSSMRQLITAAGYVVFELNYRSSDNIGNEYQTAIMKDWGKGPGEDVMAGIEAVKKLGFVDEKRIAVTGWSYGGYMTTWLAGNYPNVWKTAIAGAAVTDWNDQYNLSDNNVLGRYALGGSPWSDGVETMIREQSPITFATKIKTPTLILATIGDARVPITQSYRLYHALKDNDIPVKFVAYPVSGHFPSDPVRYRDLMKRWVAWLDEHLK